MNSLLSICLLILFSQVHPNSVAQFANCQVLIESIARQYEGDCKKGMAHGQGIATGEDTYTGKFKKGLPHGEGTYQWKNGEVFTGTWKNGMRDGRGKLIRQDSTVLDGYWLEDEYIGETKEPFQILSQSNFIRKITVKRAGSEPHKVEVRFEQNNRELSNVGILRTAEGFNELIPGTTRMVISVPVREFPFLGYMQFSARSWITKKMIRDNSFDIAITQPGHWKIVVELVGTE